MRWKLNVCQIKLKGRQINVKCRYVLREETRQPDFGVEAEERENS